jgi:hypothetical protein
VTLFDLPVFCSVVSVYLTCSISNGLLANLDLLESENKYQISNAVLEPNHLWPQLRVI